MYTENDGCVVYTAEFPARTRRVIVLGAVLVVLGVAFLVAAVLVGLRAPRPAPPQALPPLPLRVEQAGGGYRGNGYTKLGDNWIDNSRFLPIDEQPTPPPRPR